MTYLRGSCTIIAPDIACLLSDPETSPNVLLDRKYFSEIYVFLVPNVASKIVVVLRGCIVKL